jgi:Domain of unknown function (DUF6458)
MGIGVSIFLIAVGAVLTWGVERTVSGIDVNTIGVILMVVGGVGLLASLLLSSSMPWRRGAAVERDRPAADPDDPYAVERRRR